MENETMEQFADNAAGLSGYLQRKALKHNHYKAYGKMKRIVSIRDEGFLYLGTGEKWNDIPDRISFNSENDDCVRFGKCFSFSREESVAMWMLYGGLEKRSGMIDFTNRGIRSILQTDAVSVGFWDKKDYVPMQTFHRNQFHIYMTDVVYYRKNAGSYFIKRSEESIASLKPEVFDALTGCKKTFPWQYENECRLIVAIPKASLDRDCKVMRIDLNGMDLGKSLERMHYGPNYPDQKKLDMKQSDLDGTVDWTID